MKLLDERDALAEIRSLLEASGTAQLAVAFWGSGAIERLGLNRAGLSARILCNLDSGACNPSELRRINALPGITLKSHPRLHAKVYWTAAGAVLGSSNASSNGLALEGKANLGWAEANVRIDDPTTLQDIRTWFEKLFAAGYDILDADLDRAELIWKARVKLAPSGTRLVGDLITAYRNAPTHTAWAKVKLAYWHNDLSPEDEAWLANEKAANHLSSSISAYSNWNERILGDDWVLDFNLSGTAPIFGGIWKVLPKEASRTGLRLVYKVSKLQIPAFGGLTFEDADAAPFAEIAHLVLRCYSKDKGSSAVIDLATAMAILSTTSSKPDKRHSP